MMRQYPTCWCLGPAEARDVLGWAHGGFSLDAAVCMAGQDRAGLERLLRDCARPPFALERLEQINPHQLIDHLPKPRRDRRTTLVLSPLELIDALAAPLVQRLAATTAAPAPLPRGARAQLAAARGRHRVRARGNAQPASTCDRRCAILLRLGTSPSHPGLVVRCFIAAHPPTWDEAPEPASHWDLLAQPEPELEFDQRITW